MNIRPYLLAVLLAAVGLATQQSGRPVAATPGALQQPVGHWQRPLTVLVSDWEEYDLKYLNQIPVDTLEQLQDSLAGGVEPGPGWYTGVHSGYGYYRVMIWGDATGWYVGTYPGNPFTWEDLNKTWEDIQPLPVLMGAEPVIDWETAPKGWYTVRRLDDPSKRVPIECNGQGGWWQETPDVSEPGIAWWQMDGIYYDPQPFPIDMGDLP